MIGWLRTLAYRDEEEDALGRHSLLLASLVLLLVALPVIQLLAGSSPRFPTLLAIVLIAAIVVNSRQRWIFWLVGIVGGAAIAGIFASWFIDSAGLRIATDVLGLTLLGFTMLVMLNSLMQTNMVSQDTMVGGICIYLLLGLTFAMAFTILTEAQPGSFVLDGAAIARSAADPSDHATKLLYFSFVTLTTLGYGDISPTSELAQMFCVCEALMGQIYLTVFLARLVAIYVRRRRT